MKNILLATSLLLISASSQAQGFQIGYAAGLVSNYPDNSQTMNKVADNYVAKAFLQNGLFARYELKRWAIELSANHYAASYSYYQQINEPADSFYHEPAINQYTSGIIRSNNYFLDLSLQVCLNSNKALQKPTFKGIKSYLGISYSGIITHLNGQATFYDAINNTTTVSEVTNNVKHRAVGLNYYGSYQLSHHLVASLRVSYQVSTEKFTPVTDNKNAWYFTSQYGVDGNPPTNYFALTVGIAYKF